MNKLVVAALVAVIFISKFRKGVKGMDVVYATLIVNGYREFKQVPRILKERVKARLVELGLEELATEE